MNVKSVQPIQTQLKRKLIPISEYKGPKLELMFYEKDEINLLNQERMRLENEARDVLHTLNINTKLTGYTKNKCKFKLFHIQQAIDSINEQIYKIKKRRFVIQKEEFLKR